MHLIFEVKQKDYIKVNQPTEANMSYSSHFLSQMKPKIHHKTWLYLCQVLSIVISHFELLDHHVIRTELKDYQ